MKENRFFASGFLFVLVSASALLAQNPLNLAVPNGTRSIPPFPSDNTDYSAYEGLDPVYGYLILNQRMDINKRGETESVGNVSIINPLKVSQGKWIYIARTSDLASSRGNLTGLHYYHNYVPIFPDEKISHTIYSGRYLPLDSLSGLYCLSVSFYPDVGGGVQEAVLSQYVDSVVQGPGTLNEVLMDEAEVLPLSEVMEVRFVEERSCEIEFVLNESRRVLLVDSLQRDLEFTGDPDASWPGGTGLTGDSIRILIFDTGIDSLHPDFRESGGSGTVLRMAQDIDALPGTDFDWEIPNLNSAVASHGTTVAAAAAGNGWASEGAGHPPFLFRGMAPKALIFPPDASFPRDSLEEDTTILAGDVSNHSYVISHKNAIYNDRAESVDNATSTYAHKITVWGFGNSGASAKDSLPIGYYSASNTHKNGILVGGSVRGSKREWHGASLGPTRDGRIAPTIIAPAGKLFQWPDRSALNPLIIEIDSAAILDSNSNVRMSWGFDGSTEEWGSWPASITIDPDGASEGLLRLQIGKNPVPVDPYDNYLWSGVFDSVITSQPGDTLFMIYRILHSDPSHYSIADQMKGTLHAHFADTLNDTLGRGAFKANPTVVYDASDSLFSTHKSLIEWEHFGVGVDYIRMGFWTNYDSGVVSANLTTEPHSYRSNRGTSLAAPQVTGIIALMLEEWKNKYNIPLDSLRHGTRKFRLGGDGAKAILVHTATDLIKLDTLPGDFIYAETGAPAKYHKGPDFTTGFGLVNAVEAVEFVDTTRFKRDSVAHGEQILYEVTIPPGDTLARFTLVWDDPGSTDNTLTGPKLVNDLDIAVFQALANRTYYPWTIDPLPMANPLPADGLDPITVDDIKPAYKAKDFRNNVEKVEIDFPDPGTYYVSVTAPQILKGSRLNEEYQDFALVSDYEITRTEGDITGAVAVIEKQWGMDLPITSAVAIENNLAYFQVDNDSLVVFNLDLEEEAVRMATPHFETPVVSNGAVFIPVANSILRFEPNVQSTFVWEKNLPSGSGNASTPLVHDDLLFTVVGSVLYSMDADSGDILDTFQHVTNLDFTGTPVWNPVTNRVMVVDEEGFLIGISVDGLGNMSFGAEGRVVGPGILHAPTVSPSGITAVWSNTQLGLAGPNGKRLGIADVRVLSTVVWDESDVLYFIGSQYDRDDIQLIAYNLDLGEVWATTLRDGFITLDEIRSSTSDIAITDDGFLRFIFDNSLYAASVDNGGAFYQVPFPGPAIGSPNFYANRMVIGSGKSLFSVVSGGLLPTWAKAGATAAATSAAPMQNYLALYPDTVGQATNVVTQWASGNAEYQLSDMSGGFDGTSDDFVHASTYTNDDFEFSAKVESLNSPSTAGVGLMVNVRDITQPWPSGGGWNFSDDGPRGIVYLDPSGSVKFNYRDATGSASQEITATGTYVPGSTWFRISKQGTKVVGYVSNNGFNFSKVGEFDLPLDTNGYASLVHTSGDEVQSSSATLSQVILNRSPRTTNGLLALHTYNETEGDDVFDVSGLENPVNLKLFGADAELLRKGGLQFTGTDHNSVAQEVTSSQKFFDASTASDEVTIEAWIQPGNLSAFYDRILYYAKDGNNVNWMLTQKDKNIAFKLRTSFHALKVLETTSDPLSSTTSIYHVVATYKPYDNGEGGMRIYVDGELQSVNGEGGTLDGGGTYPWKSDAKFAVGNTLTGTSSSLDWDGKIFLSAVYSTQMDTSEVIKNFKAGFSSPLFDFGDWAYEAEIDLNTTSSGADVPVNVKDFPVLIRLNGSNFRFIEARENGEDIRFSTIGNSPLPHVIEKWDESNEEAIIWVKTDVPGNTLSTIRMYWGNPDVEDISSGAQVFEEENGFAAVYHLNGDPSQGVADGSSAGQNGTAQGGMNASSRVTGIIGDALRFDGFDDYVDLGTMYQDFSGGVTLCGWMKYEAFQSWSRLADLGAGESQHNIYLGNQGTSGDARFDIHNSGYSTVDVDDVFQTGEWKHVCGTEDGSGAMKFYADGVQVGSTQGQTPANVARTKSYLAKSNWSADAKYKGKMDEVWISTVARSTGWIKLSYENQKASQTLVTVHPGNNQIVDGRYQIKVVHSGKCLDVAGAAGSSLALAEGTDMQQVSCADESDKQWDVYHLGSGVYKMVNVGSGYALDVEGASTADGAKLIQWGYNGGDNQKFYILYLGNGQYKIEAKHSGKVLDVEAAGQYDGNKVIQWTYHGGLNQRWVFEAVE